ATLAAFARANASAAPTDPLSIGSSARNRFAGLVTDVIANGVMAQGVKCRPLTVVSLMSSQSVRELGLEPGSVGRRGGQGHHSERGNPERNLMTRLRVLAIAGVTALSLTTGCHSNSASSGGSITVFAAKPTSRRR